MYHTKRIGVFISHIFGDYQRHVCQGVIDKALEYGYMAEIFTSMDGENLGTYGIGEESILHIPKYDSLDGVIFVSETYLSDNLKKKISENLQQKCSCPIIEIATCNSSFPTISLDNNATTKELTDHLIITHGYQRICYLGCTKEAFFSDQRELYYRNSMEEHALSVGSNDCYSCNYDIDSVTSALSFFEQESKPDAVVCYNDRMALLFMAVVNSNGYSIPEDIAITGCDDTLDGLNASPPLTTVSFPVYELGTSAMEQLIHIMHGESIPPVTTENAQPLIRNSCGCQKCATTNPIFFTQKLTGRIVSLESSILDSMRMSAAFQHINDIDNGVNLLEKYITQIENCKEFYLCLYANWCSFTNHILEITENEAESLNNDTIQVKLAIRNGKRLPECSFRKSALLPDHIYKASKSAYIYTPLFFEDREFGYIALAYENNHIDYHFQLVHWLMNINQMLQSIYESKRTGLLVNRLEDIYLKDALTGLSNKHGFHHYSESLLHSAILNRQTLACFLFDVDKLKQINDCFGHEEGDFAIQVVGHALESSSNSEDICARFGGDEFYLLTTISDVNEAEKRLTDIDKYLDHYNRLSSKTYDISVSSGYASILPDKDFTLEQIQELIHLADKNMYLNKRQKSACSLNSND